MKVAPGILFLLTALTSISVGVCGEFQLSLDQDNAIIERSDGSVISFKPVFTIIYAKADPKKAIRYGEHGYKMAAHENVGLLYHVPVWGKPENLTTAPGMHVLDGFDPDIDRDTGRNQTSNMFLAGETVQLVAIDAEENEGRIHWRFPDNELVSLSASCEIDSDDPFPSISFQFTARRDGYYSVGYSGAPECTLEQCDELWQAMIWSEKRFPVAPYLTESFHSQLPGTFVSRDGSTYGLIGAPEHLPFMPMPTSKNSQFGMLVRSREGKVQSSIYSPVLGGIDSKKNTGDTHGFKAYVYLGKDSIHQAYEEAAREIYGFSDIRRNTTVNLNTTFENMVAFCLSEYAEFNDRLRGSNYSTDVPGAVKNISGLHPLSTAVVTDSEEIYKTRARPMLEYGMTRERFLFATDPKIKGDGTSSFLGRGPGVPMSDLSTTYSFSQKRMSYFLEVAKRIYHEKINRSLNLDALSVGDRWQNALALYRATGEDDYLSDAKAKADQYLKQRVDREQTDFQDPASQGLFFWTSYTNQFMELYLLYLTTGEQRYLDAAHDGARHYARFCWMSPKIPEGDVTVNPGGLVPRYRSQDKFIAMKVPEETVEAWRVSEHGLTPESSPTCNGHRGIFMAHHAPFLMRIAAETGDRFLHDIARNAVIGRYESFPGYHINSGRTTAFEKKDFAMRNLLELNGHTSLHYNHPLSHVTSLLDYLMAEAYYLSDRKIDFKPEYAEGYAYCRSLIYGANEGRFYDDEHVKAYMPAGLLSIDDVQLNYIAGRGNGKLYVAFCNQSPEEVATDVFFDLQKAGLQAQQDYVCEVWQKDRKTDRNLTLSNGRIRVTVPAKGLLAIAVEGANPKTQFQGNFYAKTGPWKTDHASVGFHQDNSFLLDMGRSLVSAYFMTAADGDVFKQVSVRFRFDEGPWQTVSRNDFPFEFTVEVPDQTKAIEYKFEGTDHDGILQESTVGKLER
jgi:hypothetical protein